MKKFWLGIALIGAIFILNFLYLHAIDEFSEELTSLADAAYILTDIDYAACGRCINEMSEKIQDDSLILYAFTSREKIEIVERAVQSAVEYYKLNDTFALKHELAMVSHKIEEIKKVESFSLKNIL